jgi:multidrug efflux pump subunit AcrA (membrane-fusion protein)
MGHERTPRRKGRRWLWLLAILGAIVVLVALTSLRPPEVEVAAARRGDLTATVVATGEVEGQVAEISPTLQGRVAQVYRDEGDQVRRGDLLCRIVPAPSLPAEESVLTEHESIKAPFDGVVSRRYADPGDAALPGQPVFAVADPQDTWVTALVDDIDVAKVEQGQEVEILLPSYLGRSVRGRISRVGAAAVPRTQLGVGGKVIRTRVELLEADTTLRPGMEVDVKAEAVIARDALLIPADAVVEDESGRWVYVARGDRVHRTEVKLGANNYVEAQVVEGLKAGELVVVGPKEQLRDGMRVRPAEEAEQ